MLAARERAGGAVLRCGDDGDGRGSGGLFGARASVAGGSHGAGYQMRAVVEHGEGEHSLLLDGDAQLLLHQVGPVELGVDFGHPGEFVGLAGGEILGVQP